VNIFIYLPCFFLFQCDNLKVLVTKLRDVLAKKDEVDPDEIKKQTNELQQASLKLFEMAYKKVIMINIMRLNCNYDIAYIAEESQC